MKPDAHILISGGGTGGHIFPAVSIANELRRRYPACDILFIGAENRMEMEKVPAAGYRIIGLPVSGFDRRHLLRNVKVAWRLFKSMRRAKRIVREFQPVVAIGVGGYVSGPVLKVAQRMGIPTLIQEQNSYAGVTNKLLAAKAASICVAYENMERFFPAEKIVLTGNPVRRTLLECTLSKEEARARLGLDPDVTTIFITGGSLGARTLNNSVVAALPLLAGQPVQLLWQSGKNGDASAKEALAAHPTPNVHQTAFVADMDAAYRAADLVISRAGASSISELQLLGKAAILVPSPNVAEDHQTKNAQALVERDAAVMVTDADAPHSLITTALALVADTDRLAALAANVAKMALPNADAIIVDQVERIAAQ